ncbi:MAG TPA: sugar phosphate isomerase/epimerase [bacterium]|nr:sugar phosphate isomerase/epimerase [bacterium]
MENNKIRWEMGVGLGYNGNKSEAKRKLDYIVELGYSVILASLFNEKERRLLTGEEIEEFSEILKEYSVEVYTTHAIWLTEEPNKPISEILPFQESIIEKAFILGAKCLTYHFGLCKGLQEGEDFAFGKCLNRYKVSLEDFRKLSIYALKETCRKAKKYGITVTIENLPAGCLCDLGTTVKDLLEIIKEVDEQNLGICFDSGHAFISGLNLFKELSKIGGYLFETHFHDNIGRISDQNIINDLHQPVGIGIINWIEVITGLKTINFSKPVVFEISSDENTLTVNKLNWERFLKIYEEKFSKWEF